jgi:eukaryotic-like serine/threonine-protein kinase
VADSSIAHYNLLEPIGSGGLGAIYRARDTKVGRTVALRLLEPALLVDDTRRLSLLDEARLAAKLSHPNVATLFEVSEADGHAYLVHEYIAGNSLRTEMAGQPVPARRAIEICIQIADALADGHAAGILHGDLRPENVIVTGKGSAKLLDFGLWRWTRGGLTRRAASRAPESLPPEDVAIAGYMAPEQALGSETDGRADLFSLGTILFEMLTGRNPFAAPSVSDTVMNVITKTVPAVSTVNPDVPAELDTITARVLSKDLALRYQSAAGFSAELRGIAATLDVRSPVRDSDYLLPVDDEADKVPAGIWVAGAAAVAVVAAIVWWAAR